MIEIEFHGHGDLLLGELTVRSWYVCMPMRLFELYACICGSYKD